MNTTHLERVKAVMKDNMCSTCNNDFATCKNIGVKFGEGKGKDNVIACLSYV